MYGSVSELGAGPRKEGIHTHGSSLVVKSEPERAMKIIHAGEGEHLSALESPNGGRGLSY